MKRKNAVPNETVYHASIEETVKRAIQDDCAVDGGVFELDVLENIEERMLDFVGCTFRKVQFAQVNAQRIHFSNCRFEQCDISGLKFRDGTLNRVELIGCRGTGCVFDHMKMKDVLFQDGQLNYMTLSSCRLERVEFVNCDLSKGMIFETSQKELVFSRCRLNAVEFQESPMKDVDFSDSELDGIIMQADTFRGATIQMTQAPIIMGVFGIKVKI